MKLGRRISNKSDLVLRYVAAVLSAIAVISFIFVYPPLARAPFTLGLFAVLLIVINAGLGPGLLTSVLSALGILYFVMSPAGTFQIGGDDAILLALFLLCTVIITFITAERDRQRRSAQIRAEHLARVSELSHHSLLSRDLRQPLMQATTLLAENLGLECTFVAERLAQGDAFLLIAGQGWREGAVGHEILSGEQNSLAAYTLSASHPIISSNLRTETRFTAAPLLSAYGLTSGATMVLRGAHGPFGILGAYTRHRQILTPEEIHFIQATADILSAAVQRHQGEEQLRQLNAELEQRVAERTTQLEAANAGLERQVEVRKAREAEIHNLNQDLRKRATEFEVANHELEAFSYSVSHDLRAPLSMIDQMARLLLADYAHLLPDAARQSLQLILENATSMDRLIQDLLALSRTARQPLKKETVRPDEQVRQVFSELRLSESGREVEIVIGELPPCEADPVLLRQVWINLLSNALKFTRRRNPARIEVGSKMRETTFTYFVKDNGVGFDAAQADRLFGTFQRLHSEEDYEGTGIGLALVQRIIHRHGGAIWAEAEVERGATFYFTLG